MSRAGVPREIAWCSACNGEGAVEDLNPITGPGTPYECPDCHGCGAFDVESQRPVDLTGLSGPELPAARQAIDRVALIRLLRDETGWDWQDEQDEAAPIFGCDTRVPSADVMLGELADKVLALVRPVEGVTLTDEEAEAMEAALAVSLETEPWSEPTATTLRTLAARLGASS